jgi:hypothetical protein
MNELDPPVFATGPVRVGSYLTDEVFLFRVDRCIAADAAQLVDLEDCYGLEVVRVPAIEVRRRNLRLVRLDN